VDIEGQVIAESGNRSRMRRLHHQKTVATDKTVDPSIVDHNTMHFAGVPCTRQQKAGTRLRINHVLPKRLGHVPRHHRGRLYREIARFFAEPRSVLLPINLDSLSGQSNLIGTRVISSDRIVPKVNLLGDNQRNLDQLKKKDDGRLIRRIVVQFL
jgi:hypothetical protein